MSSGSRRKERKRKPTAGKTPAKAGGRRQGPANASRPTGRRKSPSKPSSRTQALDRLDPAEAVTILRAIVDRDPLLVAEAEAAASKMLDAVDTEAVASEVREAVLGLPIEDLGARAGPKPFGYVEPTEAAWELLEETIHPYLEDLKRHVECGLEAASVAMCAGIVLGLYECEDKGGDYIVGYAPDFPAEGAAQAVEQLARASAKHGHGWRLPAAVLERVPEWAAMLGRVGKQKSVKG